MKTNDYTEKKTGYRRSEVHPTAGLVVFNDRNQQAAVISNDGSVKTTKLDGPYEEEYTESE